MDGLTGLFTGDEGTGVDKTIKGSNVDDVRVEVEAALTGLKTGRKVLVIDQLDAFLAASDDSVTSTSLSAMLLSLREVS